MRLERRHQRVDAGAAARRHRQCLQRPVARVGERQRTGDVGARALGGGAEIGLGHDDQVRDLDDAGLHELQANRPSRAGRRTPRCRPHRRRRSPTGRRPPSRSARGRTARASPPWPPASGPPARPAGRAPPSSARSCPRRPDRWTMRTRSPSSAPPLALDDGSTAITPTVMPSLRQAATSAAQSEDLPTPGGPVMPTTCALRCAPRLVEQACVLVAVGIALQIRRAPTPAPACRPWRSASRLIPS